MDPLLSLFNGVTLSDIQVNIGRCIFATMNSIVQMSRLICPQKVEIVVVVNYGTDVFVVSGNGQRVDCGFVSLEQLLYCLQQASC